MATKEARGTKRTCQIEDCGARFYDLNRDPIICPICEMEFVLAATVVEEEPEPAPEPVAPAAAP
ncbi:MAG: FYDLN acid domain-containing protein, partial [Pseudomonadota bacterium]